MSGNRPPTLLEVHRLRQGVLSEAEAVAVRARLARFGDPTSGLPTAEQARADQPREAVLGAVRRHRRTARRRAIVAVGAAAAALLVLGQWSMTQRIESVDDVVATVTDVAAPVGDAVPVEVPGPLGPEATEPRAPNPEATTIAEGPTTEARRVTQDRPAEPPVVATAQEAGGAVGARRNDPEPRPAVLVANVRSLDGAVRWLADGDAAGTLLGVGDALAPGSVVMDAGSSLSVVWTDGTQLAAMPASRWSWLEADRIALQLESGSVTVDAAEQPTDRPLTLLSPHASVEVLGTRFSVAVDGASSTVTVEEGRVAVTRRGDGATVVVGAGQATAVGDPGAGPLVLEEADVEGADVPPAPSAESPPDSNGSVDLFSTFGNWRSGEPTGQVAIAVLPRGLWRPEPEADLALPLFALDLDADQAKAAGKAFAWRVDGTVYVNRDTPHPDRTKRYGELHVAGDHGVFTDRHCYWMRGYWCELRVILLDLDSGRTAVVKKPKLVRWLKQVPSIEARFEAEQPKTPATLHRYLLELLRARPDVVDF